MSIPHQPVTGLPAAPAAPTGLATSAASPSPAPQPYIPEDPLSVPDLTVPQILERLHKRGDITSSTYNVQKITHSRYEKPIMRLIADRSVDAKAVLELLDENGQYSHEDLVIASHTAPSPEAIAAIPRELAEKTPALPSHIDGNTLTIILPVEETSNARLLDALRRASNYPAIHPVYSTREEILKAVLENYRAEAQMAELTTGHTSNATTDQEAARRQSRDDEFERVVEESPAVKFVDLFLAQAITDGASDIHLEPGEKEIRIRFRIDGVLHEMNSAPRSMQNEIISRVKILSSLDIAERRKTQDGRLSYNHPRKGRTDLRVAILPTVWGEKIVLRILDNSQANMQLAKLGFSPDNLTRFRSTYTKPYGMILVTGPTGSGKSTTLYAALNDVSTPEVNIVTIEDPVEYRVPGINQVQVESKIGLTFASTLRTILRADPDIILLGEIRDTETAKIAVEAAQTGHLVLSTLHTNSAATSVTRLAEMGVEPFLVGSVVESILAQRLVRRLCVSCKTPYHPTAAELDVLKFPYNPSSLPTLYQPAGCRDCANTGYRGRVAVHEVLTMSPELERSVVEGANSGVIEDLAIKNGMTTLKQDGWDKVTQGVTSIQEILRVIA